MRWFLRAIVLVTALATAAGPRAEIRVEIDRSTLDALLDDLTAQTLSVTLPTGDAMDVRVDDLRIVEMLPGRGTAGGIRVEMTAAAPAMRLELPLSPVLRFEVMEDPAMLGLSFENVALDLGLTRLDLAPLIPPLVYPANMLFQLQGAADPVPVEIELSDVEIRANALSLTLDLVQRAGAAAAAPSPSGVK